MEYIVNHGNVKRIFAGSNFKFGYYAFVDSNGQFVIGEERGREGGELYRGEYKGSNTPWLNDVKKENVRLYNDIVKYFKEYVKKQYVVSPSYTDNYRVTKYTNGKVINYEIMSYWEVEGYCNALESEGYTKAYDLDELRKKMEEAEEKLQWAKQAYEDAIPFALVKAN